MPSSQEHCAVCPFDTTVPNSDFALHENALVQVHTRDLAVENPGDASEFMRQEGLPAGRAMAAVGCAACIFRGNCPDYRYVYDIEKKGVIIVRRLA